MPIHPLQDRVLIRPAPADDMTAGGIMLPDIAQEKPQRGEVVAVGIGRYNTIAGAIEPMNLNVGDTVVYGKYGGQEIKDPQTGESLLLMKESDCFATIS